MRDISYFPLFLVGHAPKYNDEWSEYLEGDSTDPTWGGEATYCILLICFGTFILGANFGHKAIAGFRSISVTGKTIWVVFTPVALLIYTVIGFILAQVCSLPFQFLNSIRDKTD